MSNPILSREDKNLIQTLAKNNASIEALEVVTVLRMASLKWKPFLETEALFSELPKVETKEVSYSKDVVCIGADLPIEHPVREKLKKAAHNLIPWKKGPFRLFGLDIDAEWQSHHKWNRLKAFLPDLSGKRVLDIGSNNGYYMFRILAGNPSMVLGIDPFPRCHYQFHLLQHYARDPRLNFQMWGWQEVEHFKPHFDVIFCMGIIYHHRDPIQVLKHAYSALKPGGTAVVETIVTPGNESTCVFPEDRYAAMRNVWFVPTVTATINFLKRTHFIDVNCVSDVLHLPEEQRTTPWNPAPSYASFLDPQNPNRTLEGYPAPRRAIFIAKKKHIQN